MTQPNPTLNFNPNYAYRVGLGMPLADIFDVGLFYEEMRDEDQKGNGLFKNTYPLAGQYSEDGHRYGESDGLQNGTGSARGSFVYSAIDIEGGLNLRFDPGVYYRFMIGVRYTKYKQDMWVNRSDECQNSDCVVKGEPFGSERYLDQKIEGFGLRFGLSIIAPIKTTNLNLIGSFAYSILNVKKNIYDTTHFIMSSKKEIKDEQTNSYDPERIYLIQGKKQSKENSISITDESVTINIFDIEGGLQYKIKRFKKVLILLTAGYKYSAHYGALNTYGHSLKQEKDSGDDRSKDFVGKGFGNKDGDFISQGPFVRVGFKF